MSLYDPNTPLVTESPKTSQPKILANMGVIPTAFAANHEALNNNIQGMHDAVVFKRQTTDPEVTGDWGTLYARNFTNTGGSTVLQLAYRTKKFISDRPNTPQQVTYNQVGLTPPNQQSFIFGGYVVYFGVLSIINTRTLILSPLPQKLLSVVATFDGAGVGVQTHGLSATFTQPGTINFTCTSPGITQDFYYWAIGTA